MQYELISRSRANARDVAIGDSKSRARMFPGKHRRERSKLVRAGQRAVHAHVIVPIHRTRDRHRIQRISNVHAPLFVRRSRRLRRSRHVQVRVPVARRQLQRQRLRRLHARHIHLIVLIPARRHETIPRHPLRERRRRVHADALDRRRQRRRRRRRRRRPEPSTTPRRSPSFPRSPASARALSRARRLTIARRRRRVVVASSSSRRVRSRDGVVVDVIIGGSGVDDIAARGRRARRRPRRARSNRARVPSSRVVAVVEPHARRRARRRVAKCATARGSRARFKLDGGPDGSRLVRGG